jgi:hypothetical protein
MDYTPQHGRSYACFIVWQTKNKSVLLPCRKKTLLSDFVESFKAVSKILVLLHLASLHKCSETELPPLLKFCLLLYRPCFYFVVFPFLYLSHRLCAIVAPPRGRRVCRASRGRSAVLRCRHRDLCNKQLWQKRGMDKRLFEGVSLGITLRKRRWREGTQRLDEAHALCLCMEEPDLLLFFCT